MQFNRLEIELLLYQVAKDLEDEGHTALLEQVAGYMHLVRYYQDKEIKLTLADILLGILTYKKNKNVELETGAL